MQKRRERNKLLRTLFLTGGARKEYASKRGYEVRVENSGLGRILSEGKQLLERETATDTRDFFVVPQVARSLLFGLRRGLTDLLRLC